MPNLVAIRHVPFEDLNSFAAPLAARGYRIAYRDAPVDDLTTPDLAEADLLVVLGGPMAYRMRFIHFSAPRSRSSKSGSGKIGLCSALPGRTI